MADESQSNRFDQDTEFFPKRKCLISLEKRLAMELISRTMHDIQSREQDYLSESFISDQTSVPSNYNK